MRKVLLILILFYGTLFDMCAQTTTAPAAIAKKMQWFADAKLGIFIHAGIYAVNGVDESWSFYNKKISYANYMKQLSGFTLNQYNTIQPCGLT